MGAKNALRGYGFNNGIQRGKIAMTPEIYFILQVAQRHICLLFVERKLAGVSSEIQGFYYYS